MNETDKPIQEGVMHGPHLTGGFDDDDRPWKNSDDERHLPNGLRFMRNGDWDAEQHIDFASLAQLEGHHKNVVLARRARHISLEAEAALNDEIDLAALKVVQKGIHAMEEDERQKFGEFFYDPEKENDDENAVR